VDRTVHIRVAPKATTITIAGIVVEIIDEEAVRVEQTPPPDSSPAPPHASAAPQASSASQQDSLAEGGGSAVAASRQRDSTRRDLAAECARLESGMTPETVDRIRESCGRASAASGRESIEVLSDYRDALLAASQPPAQPAQPALVDEWGDMP